MRDADKIILKAFLAALSQQQSPLSEEVKSQLAAIAQSLENRVGELDAIAKNIPTLQPVYLNAIDSLQPANSERTKGLDTLPAQPDESDIGKEISNITRNVSVDELEKIVAILTSDNPAAAARKTFNLK